MPTPPKPIVLCILDGWGLREETEANAVALAATPSYDRLCAEAPMARLSASGEDVGLNPGQMGNSEVGHTNIGAGRVVWMDLPKIDNAIRSGEFAENARLRAFATSAQTSGGVVHIMGLMSPGGVHSHQNHIAEAVRVIAGAGAEIALHLFLDGRDTPPKSALGYLSEFEAAIDTAPNVRIATVSGRFHALDRDNRWDRVERAWRAIVLAEGEHAATAREAIEAAYARGETDEFATPCALEGYSGVRPGDSLFMTHFRADRAREILSALLDPGFDGFQRPSAPQWSAALGMVEYSTIHNQFMAAIFPQEEIVDTLGAWVSGLGKTQFRLAETEKYPHVTYFLNGGAEAPHNGEDRSMAPSPKVATYDLQPEMSAPEVTSSLTKAIRSGGYDLIVVNYANPDMVGHTGDLGAAIKAVEAVDAGVGAAWRAIVEAGGAMLVTADHGNCEMMVDPQTGEPHTAHTTNLVPAFLIAAPEAGLSDVRLRERGRLADIAPTLLDLMGAPAPTAMTGQSLLIRPK